MEWRTFIRPAITLAVVIALTEASLCRFDDDSHVMADRCSAEPPNAVHDWTAPPLPLTVRHP